MSQQLTLKRPTGPAPSAERVRSHASGWLVLALLGTVTTALAAVHVTQGTSEVDAGDLLRLATGSGDEGVRDILWASRLPRLLAAVVVGVALGAAGAVLQSVARNSLASPDTLGVNAGAHCAVVAAAAFGISLPVLPSSGVALLGGLLAAGLVLALSAGGDAGPTRMILAGSATAMALGSLTMLLLLMFEQETLGLFAWGNGSLTQTDLDAVSQMAPVVGVALLTALAMARRLDVLALGDDAATMLGLPVRRTRLAAVILAVLLCASAVTLAGPIGFVGLAAPVVVRLLVRRVPALRRHLVQVPAAALVGAAVMLGADILLRLVLDEEAAIMVPTGVVTTFIGALLLVWLARRGRDSGPTRTPPAAAASARSARGTQWAFLVLSVVVAGVVVLGMLLGDTLILLGDLTSWVRGETGPAYTFVIDSRLARVLAAVLAGAALAVAGTSVQAVCRNPLAEPGLLGITAGAGVGAVALITLAPGAGIWTLTVVAGVAAMATFALVYGLAWRGGLSSDRLVLIGVGVSAAATALITLIIVATDPWNTTMALTWLSGSTYGRTLGQAVPVASALALLTPMLIMAARRLDLLALDDDTPRVFGLSLERTRLLVLGGAALLTSTAVSAVGVVGFVGLVAPHVARALVGGLHARVLPVAALVGAVLVSLADTVGRSMIAPAQIPAGLVTAMVGTPYFVYLLWRSRR
ncbi:MAG: iron ABC transporter permease [Nocardioidaceae bacterium]